MPLFVHITPEKYVASIKRNGINPKRQWKRSVGVFAFPVLENFVASHQWLRELRRCGQKVFMGVYFRVPDGEMVYVGKYNEDAIQITAAKAVKYVRELEDPLGIEINVPRRILPKEIHKIKHLPQLVGWRYRPHSNGTQPVVCICCERGRFGIQKLRRRLEEAEQKNKPTKIVMFGRD